MTARVLPDAEDLEIDPAAGEVLEEAKRELTGRLPDVNEATIGRPIESENELDRLNARQEAARHRAEEKLQQEEPAAQQNAQPATAAAGEDADLPPEYRGKSVAQLAREYKALHSQIGHNGHELGALRQYVANLERQHAATPIEARREEPALDPVELLANPQAAINRAVTQHPAMQSLRQAAAETLARKSKAEFDAAYPDHAETVADPEFRSWVESSKVRREMIRRAHEGYDLDAARHLFDAWAARRASRSAVPTGEAPGAQASSKAKVYRRSEIQKLMIDRPDEYERRADEFARAYAAGRVR